jgi:hypothetical protein
VLNAVAVDPQGSDPECAVLDGEALRQRWGILLGTAASIGPGIRELENLEGKAPTFHCAGAFNRLDATTQNPTRRFS